MTADLTDTIVPRSDQMNAEDLLTGPRTFTIKDVRVAKTADQPVSIVLVEFPDGRPFKPSKTVRRLLVAAWGTDGKVYIGHRFTLYRDPDIKFGGMDVGGIRVSHMSHIPRAFTIALTVTRGRREPFEVQPLPDDAPVSPAVSAATLAEMRDLFARKGIPDDAQLLGVNRITGGAATSVEVITEVEAQRVLAALRQRPDAAQTVDLGRVDRVAEQRAAATSTDDEELAAELDRERFGQTEGTT